MKKENKKEMKNKKLEHDGKIWVEYKQPILKSWMLSLLIGLIWGLTFSSVKGYWNILFFISMMFLIVLIQYMYDREIKENILQTFNEINFKNKNKK